MNTEPKTPRPITKNLSISKIVKDALLRLSAQYDQPVNSFVKSWVRDIVSLSEESLKVRIEEISSIPEGYATILRYKDEYDPVTQTFHKRAVYVRDNFAEGATEKISIQLKPEYIDKLEAFVSLPGSTEMFTGIIRKIIISKLLEMKILNYEDLIKQSPKNDAKKKRISISEKVKTMRLQDKISEFNRELLSLSKRFKRLEREIKEKLPIVEDHEKI